MKKATANTEPATGAADAGKYFDPQRETLPREALARMQEVRLLELLPYAYERSPLIREVWNAAGVSPADIRSLEEFKRKAPFIDKDSIRAFRDANSDPLGGLGIAPPGDMTGVGFTSGTTGDPTPVPYGETYAVETQVLRDLWHIGVRPGDYVATMFFTFRVGQRGFVDFNKLGMIPIEMAHDPAEIPLLVEASRRFRPTVLFMISSPMLIALERYFEKTGIDPKAVFASYKGAIYGGEPLSPRFRKLVESWGLELFEYSTLGDVAGSLECSEHHGMHMWEDLALVENLDDDGCPVADGELGEMVVTALDDRWAPLIRYRTEDIVRVERSPCGCGRTHGRFWPMGRKGDQTIVAGTSVLPRDIQALVEQHRETRSCLFQIIRPQREMDQLRLRVGYDTDALKDSVDALAARLRDSLRAALQVPVDINLTPDEELLKLGPPQKIPRVTKQ